jgi:hypothetical protein
MAEFEELQLRITLVDQASAPLQKIEEHYKRLSSGATAGHIERYKREGGLLKELTKAFGLEAKGAAAHFEGLAGRAGVAAGAVAAAGVAVYAATKKVAEFAEGVRDVGRFAEELGTTYAQVKNITDQVAKLGFTEQSTRQNIAAAQRAAVQSHIQGTNDMWEDLAHILQRTGLRDELRQMLQNAKTPDEQINAELQFLARIRQYYEEHTEGRSKEQNDAIIRQIQRQELERQGFNDDLMHYQQIEKMSKEEEDRLNKLNDNAKEIANNWNATWVNIDKVKDLFLGDIFDPNTSPFPHMLRIAKEITEWIFNTMVEGQKKLEGKTFWEKFFYLNPEIVDWLHKATAIPTERGGPLEGTATGGAVPLMGDYSSPAARAMHESRNETIDENTRELKKLNDQLYALLNPPSDQGGAGGYAGGAAGDRASGENYTGTGSGRTGSHDTPVPPASPRNTPPPMPNVPKPASPTNLPSSGAFDVPRSPFDPFMRYGPNLLPGAEGAKNPPASTMAPPANPGGSIMGGDFGDPTLRNQRQGYLDELADPAVRNRLYSMTEAEVGGQGTDAAVQWQESLFNRARSRGQSLWNAMHGLHSKQNPEGYWPQTTLTKADRTPSDAEAAAGEVAMRQVLMGSNRSGLATGNASGTVGFAGGPETSRIIGPHGKVMERFGIEGPDIHWAQETRAAMDAAAQEVRQRVRTTIDSRDSAFAKERLMATGHLKVEVPSTTSSRPLSDTLFNKTPMQHQIQMPPADIGPAEPSRSAALAG